MRSHVTFNIYILNQTANQKKRRTKRNRIWAEEGRTPGGPSCKRKASRCLEDGLVQTIPKEGDGWKDPVKCGEDSGQHKGECGQPQAGFVHSRSLTEKASKESVSNIFLTVSKVLQIFSQVF